MSYLDDLLAGEMEANEGEKGSAVPSVEENRSVMDIVREQLDDSHNDLFAMSDTTFRMDGASYGIKFAEGVLECDPETGDCMFDINTHLHVPSDHITDARRYFRRINATLIVSGFKVDDKGVVHFRPDRPTNVLAGEDVTRDISRAFIGVHNYAQAVTALSAGAKALDLVRDERKREKSARPSLSQIERMLADAADD